MMLRDLRWATLAETFSRVASLVTVPILTSALVPAQYGLYRGALLTVSLFLLLNNASNIQYLLQKRIPELQHPRSDGLATASSLAVAILTILSVALLVAAAETGALRHISRTLQGFVARDTWLIIGLLVTNVGYYHLLTLTRSFDRFRCFAVASSAREGSFLLIVLGLSIAGGVTIDTVVGGLVVSNTAAGAIAFAGLRDVLTSPPDFHQLRTQFSQVALPLVPRSIVTKAATVGPDALVVAVFGTATFGIWTLVFVFRTAFEFVGRPFSNVLLPKISKRLDEGTPINPIIRRYYRVTTVLVAPGVVGAALLGQDIVRYVFGGAYVPGAGLIALLCLSFGLKTVNVITGHLFIASGRSIYDTYTQVAAASVLGVFALVGGFLLGSLHVVAAGYVASELVVAVISLGYQVRYVDLSAPPLGDSIRLIIALGVMALALRAAAPFVGTLFSLLSVVAGGAGVYFATLAATGFVSGRDIALLRRFIGAD